MSETSTSMASRGAARWMAAGFLAAAACVGVQWLAGVVHWGKGPDPRLTVTYAWTPRRVTFFTGDTIEIQPTGPGAAKLSSEAQFRVLVKSPSKPAWSIAGEFEPEYPQFTFTEPGLYDLHVDELIGGTVRGVYVGQAIVAAADQRERVTGLLRQIVARHFIPTAFTSSDEAQSRRANDEFYGAVAHEALLMLLVMDHQHLGLPADAWPGLLDSMSFTGVHMQESTTAGAPEPGHFMVASPALGPVEVDLDRHSIRTHGQTLSCDVNEYPVLRDVFDAFNRQPAPQMIAAAMTCIVHDKFVYALMPDTTPGPTGVPSLVQNQGHCGFYQDGLHELLRALNYRTRSVNVVYRSGSIHAFNEVVFEEAGAWRVFTMDATASIVFPGSLCEYSGRPPIIELPTPSALARVIWFNAATAISADVIDQVSIRRKSRWPEEAPAFCQVREAYIPD